MGALLDKKMSDCVVYPGTFDPITYGHIDLIERGLRLFPKLIVGVATGDDKNPIFSSAERVEMIRVATCHLQGVQVESFNGLLVDYLKEKNAQVVLRGLRAVSDFEFELQMALTNRELSGDIETLFLMPSLEYSFLSSRIVKAVASLGGEVSSWVPGNVYEALKRKYQIDLPSSALTGDTML